MRFDKELKLSGAASDKIIAAISHPYFKLKWLTDDKKKDAVNRSFRLAVSVNQYWIRQRLPNARYLTTWTWTFCALLVGGSSSCWLPRMKFT